MDDAQPRRDSNVFVQALIGSGHSLSHFYGLTLPPLFPLLQGELGLSYAALGFLMTLLAISSGVGQMISGFLVDRFGARPLLVGGLAIMGVGMGAIGFMPSYWAMGACVILSGLGNSVFHPCDYVILNASIERAKLGQAFSIHTFGGNVGSAAAPPVMILLASLLGWRTALAVAGSFAIVVLLFVLTFGGILKERQRGKIAAEAAPEAKTGWRLLFSVPFLLLFAFYMTGSMASSGVQSFAVTSMVQFHGITLDAANFVLTGFLATNAIGILIGGYLADRTSRQGPIIVASFIAMALLAAFTGALPLSATLLFLAFAIIGLLQGVTRPSRDIITRGMTPDRDVGKVFAFVSSGLNVGSAVAPAAFGLLLDYGHPQLIFFGIGLFMLLGVATMGTSRMYASAMREAGAQAD